MNLSVTNKLAHIQQMVSTSIGDHPYLNVMYSNDLMVIHSLVENGTLNEALFYQLERGYSGICYFVFYRNGDWAYVGKKMKVMKGKNEVSILERVLDPHNHPYKISEITEIITCHLSTDARGKEGDAFDAFSSLMEGIFQNTVGQLGYQTSHKTISDASLKAHYENSHVFDVNKKELDDMVTRMLGRIKRPSTPVVPLSPTVSPVLSTSRSKRVTLAEMIDAAEELLKTASEITITDIMVRMGKNANNGTVHKDIKKAAEQGYLIRKNPSSNRSTITGINRQGVTPVTSTVAIASVPVTQPTPKGKTQHTLNVYSGSRNSSMYAQIKSALTMPMSYDDLAQKVNVPRGIDNRYPSYFTIPLNAARYFGEVTKDPTTKLFSLATPVNSVLVSDGTTF